MPRQKTAKCTEPKFLGLCRRYENHTIQASEVVRRMDAFAKAKGFSEFVDIPNAESVRQWLNGKRYPTGNIARWIVESWNCAI